MTSLIAQILAFSQERGCPFLVVGGNAVIAYGYTRTTFDLDLAVLDSEKAQWHEFLIELGYQRYFQTEAFWRYKGAQGKTMFPIDLMLLLDATYKKISDLSVEKMIAENAVKVPDPLHIIAMKLHALKQPDRFHDGKDFLDIKGIIQSLNIDTHHENFHAIVRKYANEQTRNELNRILRDE